MGSAIALLLKLIEKGNGRLTWILIILSLFFMVGMAYEKHSARLEAIESRLNRQAPIVHSIPKMMRSLTRIEEKLGIPPEMNNYIGSEEIYE